MEVTHSWKEIDTISQDDIDFITHSFEEKIKNFFNENSKFTSNFTKKLRKIFQWELDWEFTGEGFIGGRRTYEGKTFDELGQAMGEGKLTLPDGSIYEGTWNEGVLHGPGTFISSDSNATGEWFFGQALIDEKKYRSPYFKKTSETENIKNTDLYIENLETFSGNWKNSLLDGYGEWHNPTGDWYKGEFKNGKKHGQGIYYSHGLSLYREGNWEDDIFLSGKDINGALTVWYEGEFDKDGNRHGYGELWKPSMLVYKGYWYKGKKHGTGCLTTYNENKKPMIYEGEFKNDNIHGFGLMYNFENSWNYEGNIIYDESAKFPLQFHGEGIYENNAFLKKGTWNNNSLTEGTVLDKANNDIFKGKFVNGKIEGKGIHIRGSDKGEYIGVFKNGVKNGKGILESNATKREGIWKDDLLISGEFLDKHTKWYYDGQWKNGQASGKGIMKFADGAVYEGSFLENKPDGLCIYTCSIDTSDEQHRLEKYQGTIKNYLFEDKGLYELFDDNNNLIELYEGDFKHGKRHGRGFYKNIHEKYEYEGEFLNDVMHGNGKLTHSTGILEGMFLDGLFVGAEHE